MRSRNLALLLVGCALLAAWPIFVWAMARFEWIDDRFVATLGSLTFSLPVALAAAAIVLVVHGLRVNGELYDLLELDEDEIDEEEQIIRGREAAVAAAATPTAAGAATGPNIVTVSGGTATATAAPPATADGTEQPPAEEAPSKYGNKMAVAERKNQGFKDKDGKKPKKVGRAKRTAKSMANRGKYAGKQAAGRALRDNIRFPRL